MALPERRDVQAGFSTNVHANKEYVYGFFPLAILTLTISIHFKII
jgi:hypothetical protein